MRLGLEDYRSQYVVYDSEAVNEWLFKASKKYFSFENLSV